MGKPEVAPRRPAGPGPARVIVDPGGFERTLRTLELCRLEHRLYTCADGRVIVLMKPIPGR